MKASGAKDATAASTSRALGTEAKVAIVAVLVVTFACFYFYMDESTMDGKSGEAFGPSGEHHKGKKQLSPKDLPKPVKLRVDYLCMPHIALLPLMGYGGSEANCEAEIEGFAKLLERECVDFVAVVPRRNTHGHTYSFPILEAANVLDSGEAFIREYAKLLKARDKDKWPDVIYCQSEWCTPTLRANGINIPAISTQHSGDCGGCKDLGPTVRYRMPSNFTYQRAIAVNPYMRERAFSLWYAFSDSEFDFSEEQGDYFLWVAGCGWDEQKGLPLFESFAREFPQYKFVVYCSGHPHVANRLRDHAANSTNFQFRGELMRGEPHHHAFKKAKAFFFWTHMGGETFGRVAVEAISKGTPVIGSTFAANPETIIEPDGGILTEDVEVVKQSFARTWDRHAVYQTSQRFRSSHIVQLLLQETGRWFRELKRDGLIKLDVDSITVFADPNKPTPYTKQCWPKEPWQLGKN